MSLGYLNNRKISATIKYKKVLIDNLNWVCCQARVNKYYSSNKGV